MKTKKKTNKIIQLVDEHYPVDTKCYLNYKKDWQLLVATMLSAQCTDDRVNMVTKDLFKKYKTLDDLAAAELPELEQDIYSTGFFKNKARNIKACAKALLDEHKGKVPPDIDELTALPGVGRKTANVIRGEIYGIQSIVVDTHVGRIARRLGFTEEEDPVKVEFALMEQIPEDHWIAINRQWIAHGRAVCRSQNPKCAECFLYAECCYEEKAAQKNKKR